MGNKLNQILIEFAISFVIISLLATLGIAFDLNVALVGAAVVVFALVGIIFYYYESPEEVKDVIEEEVIENSDE